MPRQLVNDLGGRRIGFPPLVIHGDENRGSTADPGKLFLKKISECNTLYGLEKSKEHILLSAVFQVRSLALVELNDIKKDFKLSF